MTKRTVLHALVEYADSDGKRALAYRGDTVDLGKAELTRLERHGAVGKPTAPVDLAAPPAVTEPVTPPVSPPPTTDPVTEPTPPAQPPAPDAGEQPEPGERPAQSAPKDAWEAYAVARGMSAEDAAAATKSQLIAGTAD